MAKILVIEDDQNSRETLVNFLRKKGFLVTQAEDGQKGIDILANNTFDIIISDLWTPTLDSISLLNKLGEAAGGAAVVIMTAHLTNLSLWKSEQVNVTAYLEKPFTMDSLFALVNNIIENRKSST